MPQITSGKKQYLITDDGKTYTLARGATRSATGTDAAIQIDASSSHTTLGIAGKVIQTDLAFAAIVVAGHNNSVEIADSGSVTGNTAIEIVSDHSHLVNAGAVLSHEVGAQAVYSEGNDLDIVNSGKIVSDGGSALTLHGRDNHVTNNNTIQGDVGIELAGGDNSVTVSAKGSITGSTVAIFVDGSENGGMNDTTRIVNAGKIAGSVAIWSGEEADTVVNSGTIHGKIELGGGDDVFDTRLGTVTEEIRGGDGDDTFYISKSSTKIVEDADGGSDIVFSSATYHLKGGVEALTLIGAMDIDGFGTKSDNFLSGNKAANQLVGMNGDDTLNGGRGTDTLEGDLGSDVFVFNTGSGKDTVSDFNDGQDLIRSNVVASQSNFDGLAITQSGADVVIDFSHGDTLTLQNFAKGDLTFEDFQQVM
jgi:Ca2+-binding RTX toxin-like protein